MGKFNKAQQKKMRRVYAKTKSLALTAKVFGCAAATVGRYRDSGGWVGLAKIKPDTGFSSLTPGAALQLAGMWHLHMEDKDACYILRISHGSLRFWLQNNTKVTIERSVEKRKTDGTLVSSEIVKETIGLHDLRVREWSRFEFTHMQKIEEDANQAEKHGDYVGGAKIRERLLAKRLPVKFADHMQQANINVNVNTAIQNNTINIDDLDLPLDVRKEMLRQIRDSQDAPVQ